MRLLVVEIEGYRRFDELQKLETDGALTAIVGPNEAGKTSLLDALTSLDDSEALDRRDSSGRKELPPDHEYISALYSLDDSDRAAIAHLDSALDPGRARLLICSKNAEGSVTHKLVDGLERDTRPREQAWKALEKLAGARWLRDAAPSLDAHASDESAEDAFPALTRAALNSLVVELKGAKENIPKATVARLVEAATDLSRIDDARAAKLATQLIELRDHESAQHPNVAARRILASRRPRFLLFGSRERDLRSEYDLSVLLNEDGDVPVALANLARLAALDLSELVGLIAEDNSAEWISRIDAANRRLASEFSAWSQDSVTVRLEKMDGYRIRLHVSNPVGGWTQLEERSDGLKMFVSLISMTAVHSTPVPPIVLIDEVERHLHYDAQADLVQVFTLQSSLPQILYTTHSAGCLPEDLGDGVRIVAPVRPTTSSAITNRFWQLGSGFSPLLVGMGASTLAFVPVRHAVMSEGASEVILLPTLLREATGRRALGYQIAPASAEAPAAHIAGIDLQAVNVTWVVDGDPAGTAIRRRLQKQGIPAARIATLGGTGSGVVLEDLLDLEVYVTAINIQLERSGVSRRVAGTDLGGTNRPEALQAWCKRHRVRCPSKIEVANRVLDQKRERRLGDAKRAASLRKLDKLFSTSFRNVANAESE